MTSEPACLMGREILQRAAVLLHRLVVACHAITSFMLQEQSTMVSLPAEIPMVAPWAWPSALQEHMCL